MGFRYYVGLEGLTHNGVTYEPGAKIDVSEWSIDVREDNLRAGRIVEVESREETTVSQSPAKPKGALKKG